MNLPDLLTLARTHRITADLTLEQDKLSGSIKIRPRKPRSHPRRLPPDASLCSSSTSPPPETPAKSTSPPRHAYAAQVAVATAARLLREIGVDDRAAEGLARMHDLDRITLVTDIARNKKSPSGFAVQALRHNWKLPGSGASGSGGNGSAL